MLGRRGFLGGVLAEGLALGCGSTFGQDVPVVKRKALKPVGPTPPNAKAVVVDERVNRLLAPVRERHELPGLIGGLVRGETLSAIGAVGVRKLGSDSPIRVSDRVHLGSCTKAKREKQIAETRAFHLPLLIPALKKHGKMWEAYAYKLEELILEAIAAYDHQEE